MSNVATTSALYKPPRPPRPARSNAPPPRPPRPCSSVSNVPPPRPPRPCSSVSNVPARPPRPVIPKLDIEMIDHVEEQLEALEPLSPCSPHSPRTSPCEPPSDYSRFACEYRRPIENFIMRRFDEYTEEHARRLQCTFTCDNGRYGCSGWRNCTNGYFHYNFLDIKAFDYISAGKDIEKSPELFFFYLICMGRINKYHKTDKHWLNYCIGIMADNFDSVSTKSLPADRTIYALRRFGIAEENLRFIDIELSDDDDICIKSLFGIDCGLCAGREVSPNQCWNTKCGHELFLQECHDGTTPVGRTWKLAKNSKDERLRVKRFCGCSYMWYPGDFSSATIYMCHLCSAIEYFKRNNFTDHPLYLKPDRIVSQEVVPAVVVPQKEIRPVKFPCKYGNQCKFFKSGTCKFFHPKANRPDANQHKRRQQRQHAHADIDSMIPAMKKLHCH